MSFVREVQESDHPQKELDLAKGLLGPNLKLKSQLTKEEIENFSRYVSVPLAAWYPHSSLGSEGIFAVSEIYADCYRGFGLERISQISQVGGMALFPKEFLGVSHLAQERPTRIFESSNRWLHCLTTAVVLELMLRNNNFKEEEIRTGIIAGTLHDAAITPFSDIVSGIDPLGFDEASNLPLYLERLDRERKENFDRKHSPDYQRIFEAVKGKGGSLGTFLKIADRLTYTATDSFFFAVLLKEKRRENPLEELADIFEKQPKLFDIFKEVKFDPQSKNVYFENPQKMAIFLRVRALMFRHVYLNPQRLSIQAALRRVVKELMDVGKIKKEDFLKITDLELSPYFSQSSYLNTLRSRNFDKIGFVEGKTREEVDKELERKGILNKQIVWTDRVAGFDTLTGWLTRDPKDGGIRPFSKVCPKETAELEKLNQQSKGIVVYFENKDLASG